MEIYDELLVPRVEVVQLLAPYGYECNVSYHVGEQAVRKGAGPGRMLFTLEKYISRVEFRKTIVTKRVCNALRFFPYIRIVVKI